MQSSFHMGHIETSEVFAVLFLAWCQHVTTDLTVLIMSVTYSVHYTTDASFTEPLDVLCGCRV